MSLSLNFFLAKEFDPAKYFDTHPALVGRKYNRRKGDQETHDPMEDLDAETLAVSWGSSNTVLYRPAVHLYLAQTDCLIDLI